MSAELLRQAKAAKRSGKKPVPQTAETAYIVALGDLQLGKVDGDGLA